MKTGINLEPPSFEPAKHEPSPRDCLQPGADVIVELCGKFYKGKVTTSASQANEIGVETPAANQMSRHWRSLLFYIESRNAVYGLATLIIPGIDPVPTNATIETTYEKQQNHEGKKEDAQLDEPEALSRDEDVGDQWTEASKLNEADQKELWYQRD